MRFLELDAGGLVLCAKPGERKAWERYCEISGRLDDLIIVDRSAKHRLNFLNEERVRAGPGGGLTENILGLLMVAQEISERSNGNGGQDREPYWRRALSQLARNLIDVLVLSRQEISTSALHRLVTSAPMSVEDRDSKKWRQSSYLYQTLMAAENAVVTERERHDLGLVCDYFAFEFCRLSEKTRSVIVSTLSSLMDVLNRSLLWEIFSTGTTFRMEDAFEGKIIVIDLPLKEFSEVGAMAAAIAKHLYQKAVERRDVSKSPRPVFLWVDEFQNFVTNYDNEFQSTARSARVASVYLAQNMPTLYAALGGPDAHDRVDSLAGNLCTKFWCCNTCSVTNSWCAEMVGRVPKYFINSSTTHSNSTGLLWCPEFDSNSQSSAGFSEQMEYELSPRRFHTLRRGGIENHWLADVIVFEGGRRFVASGKSWLPVTFRQQF